MVAIQIEWRCPANYFLLIMFFSSPPPGELVDSVVADPVAQDRDKRNNGTKTKTLNNKINVNMLIHS